jgi:hypothetical protein
MKLVIKGAVYKSGDMLVVPHYTGEFWMVDCDEFKTEDTIREDYGDHEKFIEDGFSIEHEGVTYYSCEYGPHEVDEDFELLSDLSDLSFEEQSFNF